MSTKNFNFGQVVRMSIQRIKKSDALMKWTTVAEHPTHSLAMVFERFGQSVSILVLSMDSNIVTGVTFDGEIITKSIRSLDFLYVAYFSTERLCFVHKNVVYLRSIKSYYGYTDSTVYADLTDRIPDVISVLEQLGKPIEEVVSEKALAMFADYHGWLKTGITIESADKVFRRKLICDNLSGTYTLNALPLGECSISGKWVASSELVRIGLKQVWIEALTSTGLDIPCVICGKTFKLFTKPAMTDIVCPECSASIKPCIVCDRPARKTVDDVSMCMAHAENREVSDYHSNSSRSSPYFIGTHADASFPLFLGVELEVDSDQQSAGSKKIFSGLALHLARTNLNIERVEYTRDGSLSNKGFEMISQPKTLTAWHESRDRWEKTFKALVKCNIRGHDAVGAGFHVHVSKEAFADDAKAFVRMQVILHRHFSKVLKISRRVRERLDGYAKPIQEWIDVDKILPKQLEMLRKLESFNMNSHSMLANDGALPTFEFRLFRSTLNIESFMATLDFVEGICRYANTHSFNECNAITWDELKAFINSADFNNYENRIMNVEAKTSREASRLGIEKEEEEQTTHLTAEAMLDRTGAIVASVGTVYTATPIAVSF